MNDCISYTELSINTFRVKFLRSEFSFHTKPKVQQTKRESVNHCLYFSRCI